MDDSDRPADDPDGDPSGSDGAGRDDETPSGWDDRSEWGVEEETAGSGDAAAGSGDGTVENGGTALGEVGIDDDAGGPLTPWDHTRTIASMLGLVGVAFVLGIVAVIAISVVLIVGGMELTDTDSLFVTLVGIQGIGFPLTAYGYLRYTDREFQEFIPTRLPTLKEVGLVVGSAIGALILVLITANVLVTLVGTEPAANSGGQTVQENPEIVPFLLPFVFLLNGPGEELLFRGVVQGRFREDYGGPVAIVLATLMFAPAHIVSLVGSPQAAAITISILTVPSLVFGAVYEYTDNFTVPALVHGLYNSILFGSIYLVSVYGDGTTELIVF